MVYLVTQVYSGHWWEFRDSQLSLIVMAATMADIVTIIDLVDAQVVSSVTN